MAVLKWVWQQWWIVTALWFGCAIWVVATIKHEPHKALLTVYGNGIIGTALVIPFVYRDGIKALQQNFRLVLVVALCAGFERNLTNSALYSIGGSLKTALHGLNVVFTYVVASVFGVDERGKACLFGCECRGQLLMFPVLLFTVGGSVAIAVFEKPRHNLTAGSWDCHTVGILLQLSSGICYALKYTCVKILRSSDTPASSPTKMQVAFVAQPLTALVALCFLPFFESDWISPSISSIVSFGIGVTGILAFELRLVELTSPMTVAVLSAVHNLFIVLYFVMVDNEPFQPGQMLGFGISTVGAMIYSVLRTQQNPSVTVPARDLEAVHSTLSMTKNPSTELSRSLAA